jgi:hypothetical protein
MAMRIHANSKPIADPWSRRAKSLVFGGLLGLAACAGPPLSDEARQSIRTLAVAAAPTGQAVTAVTPAKSEGEAALAGAGQGAALGLGLALAGIKSGDPYAAILFVPLGAAVAIVGAPVGALVGAAKSKTAAEVDAADGALRAALASVEPHRGIRDAFAATLLPGRVVAVLPASEPADAAALRARGIDAVLEIALRDYGFATDGRIDPEIRVLLVAETRLIRASDGVVLHRRLWRMTGPKRNYFTLAADAATVVRGDFAALFAAFARDTLEFLFAERSATAPARALTGANADGN